MLQRKMGCRFIDRSFKALVFFTPGSRLFFTALLGDVMKMANDAGLKTFSCTQVAIQHHLIGR